MTTLCHTGSATKSPATSMTDTIVSTYHLLPKRSKIEEESKTEVKEKKRVERDR